MCGIFLLFSKTGIFTKEETEIIMNNFKSLTRRGPDKYSITILNGCLIGFTRLSINDTTSAGMQPFQLDDTFTSCNGEIYNYHTIVETYPDIKDKLKSKSDCEILPHLIQRYGMEKTVDMLDGVFALCHVNMTTNTIHIGRDRIGVKPLFYAENSNFFGVSSEAKGLIGLDLDIQQLLPSTICTYDMKTYTSNHYVYHTFSPQMAKCEREEMAYEKCVSTIRELMIDSVRKRMTSDREIGCLLSGGLDSSIVSAILATEMRKNGKTLHTFSVGFPDSTDIVYARKVAEHIGSDHHELILQYKDALPRLEDVVYATETYDTTSIRASTPMFLLCEWINNNFPHKVIFSGEGSDELFCGYLYFHNAPDAYAAHQDSLRLVKNLYLYDVLRADRCTAGNGLEFREPFLDKSLVDFVINELPIEYNIPKMSNERGCVFEKTLLREAFSNDLPDSVAWRRKAAFSDAVSSSVKPWYQWIQEYVETKEVGDVSGTRESRYYKTLFKNTFQEYQPVIPLWLPNWSNVGDEPSATVLEVYKKEEH
jgi:asparagine synthase (glutamine-hydrolysing)